jgi:hypothetical protein
LPEADVARQKDDERRAHLDDCSSPEDPITAEHVDHVANQERCSKRRRAPAPSP